MRLPPMLLVALLALTSACAGGGETDTGAAPNDTAVVPAPAPAPAPAPGDDAARDPEEPPGGGFDGTTEARSGGSPVSGTAILTEVRTSPRPQAGYERVVFEFRGGELPPYEIAYEPTPPAQCGSGNPTTVAGDAYLRVRLRSTAAHEITGEQARTTVENRDRQLGYPLLQQLTLTCDFEGQVEWVLGLGQQQPYRVLELQNPTRLVVDVRNVGQ